MRGEDRTLLIAVIALLAALVIVAVIAGFLMFKRKKR